MLTPENSEIEGFLNSLEQEHKLDGIGREVFLEDWLENNLTDYDSSFILSPRAEHMDIINHFILRIATARCGNVLPNIFRLGRLYERWLNDHSV